MLTILFLYLSLSAPKYELSVSERVLTVRDSESIKYLVETTLSNHSQDTLYYMFRSCSWQDLFRITNKKYQIEGNECDKNIPVVLPLKPGGKSTVFLKISPKIKNIRGRQKIKIGFYLSERKSRNDLELSDDDLYTSRSLILSNSIELPEKASR